MLAKNLLMPPLTPPIRLPRKPTGSLMMSPIAAAARASTFFSIPASLRMVLMTALMAPIALSTRPLFSACSASIRSSSPLRASTYFDASDSTTSFCLSLTSDSSWSNLSPMSLAASSPTFCRSGESVLTYAAMSARPLAIRCLAAVRSPPTMSATREMTPSISLR